MPVPVSSTSGCDADFLAAQVRRIEVDDRLGVHVVQQPRTIVIDFSSPNVAKPMHVGHLRSTIIGDALARLLRFLGHNVITDNHLGDWGTQFGILLYGYKHYLDQEAFAKDPVHELARLYIHVRGLMKKDEDDEVAEDDPINQACRDETAKLHAGDEENLRLWKQFMPACYDYIARVYKVLDIAFDYQHGESFYHPMLGRVVEDLQNKGIAKASKGAIVVFIGDRGVEMTPPSEEDPKSKKQPPAMIRKRDGAFTYTTSDLATIRYRMEHFHPDAILYVVGTPQEFHFKQLFTIARHWGYDKVELEHVQFGSVLGEDGRPFRTRAGGTEALSRLLHEAMDEAIKVYERNCQEGRERGEEVMELGYADKQHLAEVVGVGAVKYADLSQNRASDYIFSFEKMLAMTGNTATYMQNAYVRTRAIFRKGNIDAEELRRDPPPVRLTKPEERLLALQLLRLEDALLAAAEDYKPSQITSYLWDLCKAYSSFYVACPVLKAETPELRQSRLVLCDVTARVIQRCLDFLNIKTVEEM